MIRCAALSISLLLTAATIAPISVAPISVAWAAEPVTIGVAEIGFLDSTGAPDTKQKKARVERAKKFAEALRKDLGADGKFKIVTLDCGADPCSIANQPPEDLIAAAKKAGARVLVYGSVQKSNPEILAQAVDIDAAKLVFNQAVSLSGDDAKSWQRAQHDLAEALLKAPLAQQQ
jgi:hypothetical protein